MQFTIFFNFLTRICYCNYFSSHKDAGQVTKLH